MKQKVLLILALLLMAATGATAQGADPVGDGGDAGGTAPPGDEPGGGEPEQGIYITGNSDGAGNYWATYYNASQGFVADQNTTVYQAAVSGSSLVLTEVTGREIPAGQAVILKSSAASITLTLGSTSATLTGNQLKGGTDVAAGCDAYTLSRGSDGTGTLGFYKYSGSLDGSKAHLEIASSSARPRGFIGFGDGTTAIEAPTATISLEDGEWYSLDGRRLSGKPARKGIYMKNGQKFIIK